MQRRAVLLLVSILGVSSITGCAGGSELSELNHIQAMNSESNLSENYQLSYTDEQSMIYSQVSDRRLLDLSTLSACSEDELQQVISYMDMVDSQLAGGIAKESGVIDECFTDYLIAEFQKTPYFWQRTNTVVRGIDPVSRSIVVDVNYKTIGFQKEQQLKSPLVLGEPNYEKKMQTRYNRWISILSSKYNNFNSIDWQSKYDEFIGVYGDPAEIYKSQSNLTLTDLVYETGNQKTYAGLIDSESETSGAKMSVRYILVPNYVLGINLGITCKHMYVTDYKLDSDITSGLSVFTDEGYSTVTDSVYRLIYAYFQCIDESNFSGLYSLTTDFGKLDRYFEDMFDTSYRKHENFSISLFGITGTHITCGVTVSSKSRAKGSYMTFPSYTDRYYFDLELIDGVLQVQNMVLLSRTIQGEPTITTDEAEASGFASTIDLNNTDRLAIENLIANFGAIQLEGDTSSDKFGELVDLSMPTSSLTDLQASMTSLSGVRKVSFISNYQQGTSNYASVRCRELFQAANNSIVEAVTVYDFILKGGSWYIYQYNITSSVKLDTTNLQTTGSLCLVSPGKVESYTSQIHSTVSVSENISDISVTYDHKEYMPTLKTGTQEQGLNKSEGYTITGEVYTDYINRLLAHSAVSETETSIAELDSSIVIELVNAGVLDSSMTLDAMYREMTAIYFNYTNNRYLDGELRTAVSELETRWDSSKQIWNQVKAEVTDRNVVNQIERAVDATTKAINSLGRIG